MSKREMAESRRGRAEAQRIYDRIEAGKVKCRCGGKARAQLIPTGGCGSLRQKIRIHCRRARCLISSKWHDDHDTVVALG